jgi:hypothetical protein
MEFLLLRRLWLHLLTNEVELPQAVHRHYFRQQQLLLLGLVSTTSQRPGWSSRDVPTVDAAAVSPFFGCAAARQGPTTDLQQVAHRLLVQDHYY